MGSEQTSDLSVTDLLVQWREGDDEALEQLKASGELDAIIERHRPKG